MRGRTTVFLSVAVAYLSVTRLLLFTTPFQLVGVDKPAAWIGFAAASIGILFRWEHMRSLSLRWFFHAVALVLVGVTIYGLISPTFGGLFTSYVHIADLFVTLESAIILWLVGSEQREDALPFLLYLGFAIEFVLRSLSRRLAYPTLRRTHRHA